MLDGMNKSELSEYAKEHHGVVLDKRKSEENMRKEIAAMDGKDLIEVIVMRRLCLTDDEEMINPGAVIKIDRVLARKFQDVGVVKVVI